MRRQLVLVMVGIVAGALLLAGAGTYLLAGRGVRTDAEREVLRQAHEVAAEVPPVLAVRSRPLRRGVLQVLRETDGLHFLVVGSGGVVRGRVPAGIDLATLDPARLSAGGSVSGTSGGNAFAAVGVPSVKSTQVPAVAGGVLVVLLVQPVPRAGLGLWYLLLVSGGALVVAAAAAVLVSRRITGPLRDAATTTRRIAGGDLEARVPEAPGAYPELASLGASINSMAQSLARSRTLQRQFLLSVSHDLRTPLTSILGYAEAIGDGTVADVPSAAGIIGTEARRLERLVGDLLELARLDSQQFSLRTENADIAQVVRSTAEGFRPTIEEAGLSLLVVLPEGAPLRARTDPDRLSQVVANLVENAFKFAAGQVRVWAGPVGSDVGILVDDDGPGIAPGEQVRVFERFYQGAGRRAARQAGSGLGLAIVAELVGAMGGSVSASSPAIEGRGTRVAVRLPADGGSRAPAHDEFSAVASGLGPAPAPR